MNLCQKCETRPTKSKHFNSKYCEPCRIERLTRPKGTMTQDQISKAKKLVGKMDRNNIAKTVGVSVSNLKRSMPGVSFTFHNKYKANPDLVKKVCAYYEKHGKIKTQDKFPNIKVRSVVERYKDFNPRQTKLKDWQFIELAKMGGLISLRAQAKFLNRPRANAGSIKSFMYKRFHGGLVNLNGIHFNKAKYFCHIKWAPKDHGWSTPGGLKCPHIVTKYWRMNNTRIKGHAILYLWVDIEKNLRGDAPQFMRDTVSACAKFQRWIWKCDNPRPKILKMIREREVK